MTVIAADNYLRGYPRWIFELGNADSNITVRHFDITHPWPDQDLPFDLIIHCASVASPKFYRKYPLETLDTNLYGLRHMLNLSIKKVAKVYSILAQARSMETLLLMKFRPRKLIAATWPALVLVHAMTSRSGLAGDYAIFTFTSMVFRQRSFGHLITTAPGCALLMEESSPIFAPTSFPIGILCSTLMVVQHALSATAPTH